MTEQKVGGEEKLFTRLPDEVRDRLAAVRRRLLTVELLLGGARAALAIALAVVVSFVLDKGFEPPRDLRQPFSIFVFGSAAAVAAWFLATPWRRRLDDDGAAVIVERAHPQLGDVLVSSVQLSRLLETGDAGHTSRALIGSTIARCAEKTRDVDFGSAVDARPLFPAFLLTAAAFAALGMFAVMQPDLASAYWKRVILLEDASYPKPIDLELSIPKDGIALASGDDLTVDVHATRGASRIERIVVKTKPISEDGKERAIEVRPLLQVGDGRYRKVYQNVTETFEFKVDAGHGVVTDAYRVKVVARPRIEGARFWLTCPEYTGLPATPKEKPVTEPDLRVPVGTEIRYEATSSIPLAEARLVFERDVAPGPRPARTEEVEKPASTLEEPGPAPTLGGEGKEKGRKLTGSFVVTRTTRFKFALRSTEGYDDGKKPVVFAVTAVVDRPPDVKIPVPGRTEQATPRATMPLQIEIKDDYGIFSAELRWTIDGRDPSKPPEKQPEKQPLAGIEEGTKGVTLKTQLDLAGMGLKPGDHVTYRALATDRNIDEAHRVGESPTYQIFIVGPEDMIRTLQDRLQRLKDELFATAKVEHAVREDADQAVRAMAPKGKLDEGDRQKLSRMEAEQRKVTSRLRNIAQEMERIIEKREQNRLGDQRELERTKELHDAAKELAEKASPEIERELDDGRKAQELDEKTKTRLARVPDLMDAVENEARKLAESIDQWGDTAEILRALYDAQNEQGRVIKGTEAAIKEKAQQGK